MGADPSAKLFYGYVWGEDERPDGEAATVDRLVAEMVAAAGVTNPWDEWRKDLNQAKFTEEHRAEIDAWQAATRQAKDEVGVDWGHHGSDYDLRDHLYALGSLVEVEWSDTEVITSLTLNEVGQAAWRHKLDKYLQRANISRPAGATAPAWHLASLYF